MNMGSIVPVKRSKKIKARPNRIFELMKERHWTYPDVAEHIRAHAKSKNLDNYVRVHEVTINRLALGKAKLTQDWMNLLGDIFRVPPHEIISQPSAENIRRVRVICALQDGRWIDQKPLPANEQFDIMIPNDPQLEQFDLYAGEIRGEHFNLRYPDGSLVVLSKITQRPDDIVEGKRYHVRATRGDGKVIETIRSLVRDEGGKYWLKPESTHPEHQKDWLPLGGGGNGVEIIGRVRGVFFREE